MFPGCENPICGSFAKLYFPFLVFFGDNPAIAPTKGGIGKLSNSIPLLILK
jgi:hypothetical protein